MPDKTQPSFDLNEFNDLTPLQEEGLEIEIVHPITFENTGMKFVVAGPDSKRRLRAQRKIADRRLQRRKFKMSAEELEKESRNMLAACVISWSGFVQNGTALECTPENVVKIFENYPFVYEQVDSEAGDRASFFKKSETTSPTT